MTIREQHVSIYELLIHQLEQFIEIIDILGTGHLPITLISPTQLTHMLDQVKTVPQKKTLLTLFFLNFIIAII